MNNVTSFKNDANPAFWDTRYGLVKAIERSDLAARSLQHYGEWAEPEIDLISGYIEDDHHVLEVGSEYGAHTLWLAQAVGANGRIHVAEPDRLSFQLLCANVAINGLDNVYAHAFRLGESDAQAGQGGEQGQVRSLDSMQLTRLDLLKSNVTGDLIDLLAGGVDTIRRCRPLIYARMSGVATAEAEVRALKELGYRCWSHAPHMHNARNYRNAERNIFPGCVWQNVVAAPTESRFELDAHAEL